MLKKVFFLLFYYLSPLLPILAIFNSNTARYSNYKIFIPMILGSMAYTWLIFEFILSARPKFIERYFGLDKFYRFHGLMAIIAVTMVFIHKILFTDLMGEFSTSEMGDKAFYIYLAVIFLALIFMADLVVKKIKPLYKFRKIMEKIKVAKYEYQVAIHNLSVIGLVLMFIHVMMTYGAKSNLLIRSVYIFYFVGGIGFYLYHKVIRLLILKNRRFIIKGIKKESETMYSLNLVPENGKIFNYKPGQFGFVRIFSKNIKAEEHPFSFSSEPTNNDYVSVTVKELGDYTSSIKNVVEGDKVFLDAPYGNFSYIDKKGEDGIVLICGGVGITPALSILRYIFRNDKSKKVTLIWGINNQSELINKVEFEKMAKEMQNFYFTPVMFKDDTWEGERGVINKEKILSILKNNSMDVYKQGYYICGPSIMLNNVLRALKDIGIKRRFIHYEKFSL
ncbi:MAG: ferredoxin reductase family protein [Bacillota bacterium]|nr:ferredoxin reductase family protein [Bacillota bacterium]